MLRSVEEGIPQKASGLDTRMAHKVHWSGVFPGLRCGPQPSRLKTRVIAGRPDPYLEGGDKELPSAKFRDAES